jgi:predicted XRE-type DNA-binding protein
MNSQRELPLVALLRGPEQVRDDILRTFGDYEEAAFTYAVRWAWDHRRVKDMTQARASELMGIQAPHFSNILSGKKYLPVQKINAFEAVVGNSAVSQTVSRFADIRKRQMADQLANLIAENIVRAA